ncbi:hypothetical protein Sm713_14250 [Streptomyces sp. TS71-3]|nr:hypothetical protein Sm713_14250 [Streptomyces sp. TS71-3]
MALRKGFSYARREAPYDPEERAVRHRAEADPVATRRRDGRPRASPWNTLGLCSASSASCAGTRSQQDTDNDTQYCTRAQASAFARRGRGEMTLNPTDPEIFDDDIHDIGDTDIGEREDAEPGEVSPEAPEADTAEQYAGLVPSEDFPPPEGVPPDVNEADLAEQARVVDLDEDDYR